MRIEQSQSSTIHVCQSSTCQSKGSEAVLLEIEELANLLEKTNCKVKPTGCLGYCRQGPAVAIVKKTNTNSLSKSKSESKSKTHRIHVHVDTLEKSANVIQHATGIVLNLENLPMETEIRLLKMKKKREREHAMKYYQWNRALKVLEEEEQYGIKNSNDDNDDNDNYFHLLNLERTNLLSKAGYNPYESIPSKMPESIENYVPWRLQSVEIVSSHSAILKLSTDNPIRSTPHPRGHGRISSPVTWHITMLGEVGFNDEGPLPWIERDYTPISSALEWERGNVDILIKIYNDGQLTSWLKQSRMNSESNITGTTLYLSKPIKTLSLPNLTPDEYDGFKPSSILLLLAGTGIVALPQILAHREPYRLLGIPTPRSKQLQCPIDLVFSCRDDDLFLLGYILDACKEAKLKHPKKYKGLRHCTLLITTGTTKQNGISTTEVPLPFPNYSNESTSSLLQQLQQNDVIIHKYRLNKDIISKSIEKMVEPCRVLVSGPDSYNQAARELLDECDFPTSTHLTVLSA